MGMLWGLQGAGPHTVTVQVIYSSVKWTLGGPGGLNQSLNYSGNLRVHQILGAGRQYGAQRPPDPEMGRNL